MGCVLLGDCLLLRITPGTPQSSTLHPLPTPSKIDTCLRPPPSSTYMRPSGHARPLFKGKIPGCGKAKYLSGRSPGSWTPP